VGTLLLRVVRDRHVRIGIAEIASPLHFAVQIPRIIEDLGAVGGPDHDAEFLRMAGQGIPLAERRAAAFDRRLTVEAEKRFEGYFER